MPKQAKLGASVTGNVIAAFMWPPRLTDSGLLEIVGTKATATVGTCPSRWLHFDRLRRGG
jgi:hypothetical protein